MGRGDSAALLEKALAGDLAARRDFLGRTIGEPVPMPNLATMSIDRLPSLGEFLANFGWEFDAGDDE